MAIPAPTRRWFQFSLRTLLIFVTLCAIACSWLAVKMREAERQRKAVEGLCRMGNLKMHFDWKWRMLSPPPNWLKGVLGNDFFGNLTSLHMEDAQAMEGGLEHFKELTELQILELERTHITEKWRRPLERLPKLQELYLSGEQITDTDLEYVKGLHQLQWLNLDNTQVTDAGLENLKGLSRLRSLRLVGSKVTDAGLENLKGLSQLKELELRGTKVTEEGVKKLQEALPNCTIIR